MKVSYSVRASPTKGRRPTLRIRRQRRKTKNVMVQKVSRSSNWVRRFSAAGFCFLTVIACVQATLGLMHEGKASIDPTVLTGLGILGFSFTKVWSHGKKLMRILKGLGNASVNDRAKPIAVAQETAKQVAAEVLRTDKAKKKSKKVAINKLVDR